MRTVIDPQFRGELVNRLRAAGISQNQLAKDANLSAGYVSEIINGVKTPTATTARALDNALDANGELVALIHPLLSDDDADRFTAAVNTPAIVGRSVVESLVRVLAAQRDLDDTIGSEALVKPVRTHLDQISRMAAGARGPHRRAVVQVGGQWAQFLGWLCCSTGRYDEATRWLRTALQWSIEAGDRDLGGTITSYLGHVSWLQLDAASTIRLAEAVLQDESVFPAQRAFDSFQAARGYALYGELAEADRLLGRADELVAQSETWTDAVPAWQYQRSGWTWLLERGLVLRYAARHDSSRSPDAVAALRAGVDMVPEEWRGSDWYSEYVIHLASALMDAGDLDAAAVELARARRIAEVVSSARVLRMVEGRERRLMTGRLMASA